MNFNKDNELKKEMELKINRIKLPSNQALNKLELGIIFGNSKKVVQVANNTSSNSIEINEKVQISEHDKMNHCKLRFELKSLNDTFVHETALNITSTLPNQIIKSQLSKDYSVEYTIAPLPNIHSDIKPLNILNMTKLTSEGIIRETAENPSKNFCESFFIASLPQKNAQMIQNSNIFPSQCKHRICSSFPVYQPEVITRYPFEDKNSNRFNLNNLIASLCFPFGIKICFGQCDNVIPEQKHFMTVTTNELGKRNYIYVYQSFYKMEFMEFKEKYDCDPIKDYLLKMKIITLLENCKNEEALQDQIEANFHLSQALVDSTYVYIPVAYCLVSRYPYINQMKNCIESLIRLKDEKEQKYFLKHLTYEIPIPTENSRLYFYIPYQMDHIEVEGKNSQGIALPPNYMKILFEYFTRETLIKIFTMIIFEQKILLVSSDRQLLTKLSLCLINLIYPLRWKYTYIPVMCFNILKFLQAFVPFIMGIDEEMFPFAKEYFDEDTNINIIYLKSNKKSIIKNSQSFNKTKSKVKIAEKELPSSMKSQLMNDLEEVRKIVLIPSINDSSNNDDDHQCSNKKIRKCFMKCLCILFGNYKRYVSIIDHYSYFNSDSFLQEKDSNLTFHTELISTGLFQSFIQSNSNYHYFDKYSLRYCSCPFKSVKTKLKHSLTTNPNLLNDSIRKTKHNLTFSDSEGGSTLNVSNNSGNKKNNNFIISPYFIQPLPDLNKIEEAMIQKYKTEDEKSPIINMKTPILIINTMPQFLKEKEEYNHQKYHLPYRRSTSKSGSKPNDKPITNIFDEKMTKLEDTMKAILTSNTKLCQDPITDSDFLSADLRNGFSQMIYQEKFNQSNSHILDSKNYYELSRLVFSALVYGRKDYEQSRLITKSLFYYYKRNNQKEKIFLFQAFERKKPFDIWQDEQFWYEWFNDEKEKKMQNEDNYFMIITSIASIMNDLNIEINFQLYCLNERIANEIIADQNLIKALEVTMIKQYNYRKEVLAN